MKSLETVAEYAKSKGFNRESRVLQISHKDLDGIVSVINMFNYINPLHLKFTSKSYHNVDKYVHEDVLMNKNVVGKFRPDFVILTDISIKEKVADVKDIKHIPKKDIPDMIVDLELEMKAAADDLNFERAIYLRDRINKLLEEL